MGDYISSQENDSKLKSSISNIDKEERQNLFDTFVSHGGKVVDQKDKINNVNTIERRSKVRDKSNSPISIFKDEINKTKTSKDTIAEFQAKDTSRKIIMVSDAYIAKMKKRYSLTGINLFLRRFNSFISGITDFSGKTLQARFMRETYIILSEDIVNLKAITSFIVGSSLFRRVDMIKSFANTYPIFTEMILRINSLKLDQITPKFKSQNVFSLESSKIYYFMIIKSVFPFLGRKDMLLAGYNQCFRVLKQLQLYNKQFLGKEEERLNKAIKSIFDSFIPKLTKLYKLLIQSDVEIVSPVSKDILELTEADFLGSWGQKIQEVIASSEKKGEENSENSDDNSSLSKEADEVQESLNQGLKMISSIVLDESKVYPEINSYPKRDKIFIIAYLLDYCTQRYWILNNRKYIIYVPTQEQGERFSLEILMNEFFINIEKFHATLKNYSQLLTSLIGFNADIDAPKDSFIAISREEENLQEMRSKLNKQLRAQVLSFIGSIVLPLGQRRDHLSRYMQNPDITLDPNIFKNTPFSVYTPLGILQDFYQFIKALHHLLGRGELSGNSNIVPLTSELLHLQEE